MIKLLRRKYSGKITLEYSRRNNMKITSYDQILLFCLLEIIPQPKYNSKN